jgi:hypothetical protein
MAGFPVDTPEHFAAVVQVTCPGHLETFCGAAIAMPTSFGLLLMTPFNSFCCHYCWL